MLIRQEEEKDYQEVTMLVQTAFAHAEHRDGNEHHLVENLRKSAGFIPELSLVAQENDMLLGHILFSKAQLGKRVELALAPLSVLPPWQKKGVGTALIERGHALAKKMGYTFSVVLGSERYYSRFGYRPASEFGIFAPFEVPDENFMALRLNESEGKVNAVIQYDAAFFK